MAVPKKKRLSQLKGRWRSSFSSSLTARYAYYTNYVRFSCQHFGANAGYYKLLRQNNIEIRTAGDIDARPIRLDLRRSSFRKDTYVTSFLSWASLSTQLSTLQHSSGVRKSLLNTAALSAVSNKPDYTDNSNNAQLARALSYMLCIPTSNTRAVSPTALLNTRCCAYFNPLFENPRCIIHAPHAALFNFLKKQRLFSGISVSTSSGFFFSANHALGRYTTTPDAVANYRSLRVLNTSTPLDYLTLPSVPPHAYSGLISFSNASVNTFFDVYTYYRLSGDALTRGYAALDTYSHVAHVYARSTAFLFEDDRSMFMFNKYVQYLPGFSMPEDIVLSVMRVFKPVKLFNTVCLFKSNYRSTLNCVITVRELYLKTVSSGRTSSSVRYELAGRGTVTPVLFEATQRSYLRYGRVLRWKLFRHFFFNCFNAVTSYRRQLSYNRSLYHVHLMRLFQLRSYFNLPRYSSTLLTFKRNIRACAEHVSKLRKLRRQYYVEWDTLSKCYKRFEPAQRSLLNKLNILRRGHASFRRKLTNDLRLNQFTSNFDIYRLSKKNQPRFYINKVLPPEDMDLPLWLEDTNTVVGLAWYDVLFLVRCKLHYQYEGVIYYMDYLKYYYDRWCIYHLLKNSAWERHLDAYKFLGYVSEHGDTTRCLYFVTKTDFSKFVNGTTTRLNRSFSLNRARRGFVRYYSCLYFSYLYASAKALRITTIIRSANSFIVDTYFWCTDGSVVSAIQCAHLYLLYYAYPGRSKTVTTNPHAHVFVKRWSNAVVHHQYMLRTNCAWLCNVSKLVKRDTYRNHLYLPDYELAYRFVDGLYRSFFKRRCFLVSKPLWSRTAYASADFTLEILRWRFVCKLRRLRRELLTIKDNRSPIPGLDSIRAARLSGIASRMQSKFLNKSTDFLNSGKSYMASDFNLYSSDIWANYAGLVLKLFTNVSYVINCYDLPHKNTIRRSLLYSVFKNYLDYAARVVAVPTYTTRTCVSIVQYVNKGYSCFTHTLSSLDYELRKNYNYVGWCHLLNSVAQYDEDSFYEPSFGNLLLSAFLPSLFLQRGFEPDRVRSTTFVRPFNLDLYDYLTFCARSTKGCDSDYNPTTFLEYCKHVSFLQNLVGDVRLGPKIKVPGYKISVLPTAFVYNDATAALSECEESVSYLNNAHVRARKSFFRNPSCVSFIKPIKTPQQVAFMNLCDTAVYSYTAPTQAPLAFNTQRAATAGSLRVFNAVTHKFLRHVRRGSTILWLSLKPTTTRSNSFDHDKYGVKSVMLALRAPRIDEKIFRRRLMTKWKKKPKVFTLHTSLNSCLVSKPRSVLATGIAKIQIPSNERALVVIGARRLPLRKLSEYARFKKLQKHVTLQFLLKSLILLIPHSYGCFKNARVFGVLRSTKLSRVCVAQPLTCLASVIKKSGALFEPSGALLQRGVVDRSLQSVCNFYNLYVEALQLPVTYDGSGKSAKYTRARGVTPVSSIYKLYALKFKSSSASAIAQLNQLRDVTVFSQYFSNHPETSVATPEDLEFVINFVINALRY